MTGAHPFRSARNAVFLIAEVGGNHEGDVARARVLNKLAIESGADVVKYQFYTGDTLVSSVESPDRNAHFKRFEIPRSEYEALAAECNAAGRGFMASVWNTEMLAWANPLFTMHKVGSGDLTCYPMLKALVATKKPIILSTGLSTLDEVAAAVDYVIGLDPAYRTERKLAILQCTSAYPTPDQDANLEVMATLRSRFGLPVGYSDHTLGPLAIEAAVAMGAEIVEKHFTDQREGRTFRDHQISLTRDELLELWPRLARIAALRGSSVKAPTPSELAAGHVVSFRRSVYAARDIAAGETFTTDNLTVLRPQHGISATKYESVLGKKAKRAMKRHEVLKPDDV